MLFNGHLAPRILIDHSLPPDSSSLHSLLYRRQFLCSMNADDSRHPELFIIGGSPECGIGYIPTSHLSEKTY